MEENMGSQILSRSAMRLEKETWLIDYVKKNRERFVYEVVPNYVTVIQTEDGKNQQRFMVRDIRRQKTITLMGHRIAAIVNRSTGEYAKADQPLAIMNMVNETIVPTDSRLQEWYEDHRELREIVDPPGLDENGCIANLKAKLPWPAFSDALDYSFLEKVEKRASQNRKVWTRGVFPKLRLNSGDILHFNDFPDGNPVLQVRKVDDITSEVEFSIFERRDGKLHKLSNTCHVSNLSEFMELAQNGLKLQVI